ncbi:MAG: hypothetical protein NC203_02965 [Firmicutes bacterium]|nr:hypothetical protein [[Eubacterium] siraeum]MCM1487305.1 hypothetical protein [Bacillota bacterium]
MFQKSEMVSLSPAARRRAVESLYIGVCTVVEYQSFKDEKTGITSQREAVVLENQPCRLSYELNYPVDQGEQTGKVSQRVKLFVAPETVIKNGSKVIVTQNGNRVEYAFSGESAAYDSHREIRLSPFKGWA